jgi:hypothetical protein
MPRTPDEIIQDLIGRLDFHCSGASIHQDPYKLDLFRLCEEAHAADYFDTSSYPLLTGQALNDRLSVAWAKGDNKKQELLGSLIPIWDEWRYALNNQRSLHI